MIFTLNVEQRALGCTATRYQHTCNVINNSKNLLLIPKILIKNGNVNPTIFMLSEASLKAIPFVTFLVLPAFLASITL